MLSAGARRPECCACTLQSEIMSALQLCGRSLVVIASIVAVTYVALHFDAGGESLDPSTRRLGWLNKHTPQQAHHDAELLRRRMLANLIEQPDSALVEHATAIIASLDHEDDHIRNLAVSMLERISSTKGGAAIVPHAANVAERLESSDGHVRLAVVRALTSLSPAPLASFAPALVEALADDEPSVRWAVLEALGKLEPDELAKVTLTAIDKLIQQQDLSIAKAAVSAWASRLDPSTEAHGAVLNALSRLGMAADAQQGSSSSTDYMGLLGREGRD